MLLENTATATWIGSGNAAIADGGVFDNLAGATFAIQGDAAFATFGQATGTFRNEGTVVKSLTGGTTTFNPTFNNRGVVQVQSGTLDLEGSGLASGSFSLASGTSLVFGQGGYDLQPTSTVAGTGTVVFGNNNFSTNGTTVVSGTFTPTFTDIAGGTADFTQNVTLANLAVSSGFLTNIGTVNVSGTLDWTSGFVNGPGAVVSNGTLVIDTTRGNPTLVGTLDNAKSGTIIGSGFFALDGTLDNLAGANLTLENGPFIGPNFSPTPEIFRNEGTLNVTGSGTTANVGANYTNTGTVDVQSGATLDLSGNFSNFSATTQTLQGGKYMVTGRLQFNSANVATNAANIVLDGPSAQVIDQFGNNALASLAANAAAGRLTVQNGQNFTASGSFTNGGTVTVGSGSSFTASGAYTQTGGSTTLQGGTLSSSGGVNVQAGNLTGPGIINGDVVNAGRLNPGGTSGSTGLLTINGNYTQTYTGTLHVGLAGTTPASQFDQLAVNGTATLAGTLDVALAHGFSPTNGDSFPVLTFSSENGVFTKYHFPTLSGGLIFSSMYNSNNFTLLVQT
jgi:hypothetical protein